MKIVTSVVNNPIFIEIQYYTLQKYFKGDYEFIVFNDAKEFPDFTNDNDITIHKKIQDICNKLNILCINIPNEEHKINKCPVSRTSDSINFIFKYQIENPDKYLLIDSDMFLVDFFDINKYSKYECAVVLQSRFYNQINYIWNGLYYFDMHKIKNPELLNWKNVNYNINNQNIFCDVGGLTQQWLEQQLINTVIPTTEEIRWSNKQIYTDNTYFIKHLWSCSWNITEIPDNLISNTKLIHFLQNDVRNKNGKFYCEIYDNVFLHYRAGGNWNNEGLEFHNKLTNLLKDTLM